MLLFGRAWVLNHACMHPYLYIVVVIIIIAVKSPYLHNNYYISTLLLAVLLSLHLVTFLVSFITCLCHFFYSRRMPELRFAITQLQKSVLTRQHILTIDSGISYTGSIV